MVASSISMPVEEDDVPRHRLISRLLPLILILEPTDAVADRGELRDDAFFDISALVRAPGYIAGTPLNAVIEPIPAPELLAALIPDLLRSHLRDLCVTDSIVVIAIGIITKHMGYILLIAIGLPAMLLGLLIGKGGSVLNSITAITFDSPSDIAIPIVIPLQSQAYMFHIKRIFDFGLF